jgi:hypothetical protein
LRWARVGPEGVPALAPERAQALVEGLALEEAGPVFPAAQWRPGPPKANMQSSSLEADQVVSDTRPGR